MKVWCNGTALSLAASALLGTGGEAEVYDAGGGRAIKLFKPADHPDLAGQPVAQEAARRRLAALGQRLADFPAGLPPSVVAPGDPVTRSRRGPVAGYAMRLIGGAEPLWRLGDLAVRRRPSGGDRAVAVLRDLYAAVDGVHTAGVVIGDFNDLNVLVARRRAHLIDADSFQYGGWSCPVFSERFVDPRLCDPTAAGPVLACAHDADSDWYAFAVMVLRTLLGVGPWGGVHRPGSGPVIPTRARPLHRLSVFRSDVVYPRAAIPLGALPDPLAGHLEAVFERDRRGRFPAGLLDDLRWTRCRCCGSEHARAICPSCSGAALRRPVTVVRGRVRADTVAEVPGHLLDARLGAAGVEWLAWHGGELVRSDGARLGRVDLIPGRVVRLWRDGALVIDPGRAAFLAGGVEREVLAVDACDGHAAIAVAGDRRLWIQGGLLHRDGSLGAEVIGRVLAGRTRLWAGAGLVFGCYRAGALGIGFTARPDRGSLLDGLVLPTARGRAIDAHCVVGDRHAWLFSSAVEAGRTRLRAVLYAADGRALASADADSDDPGWLAGAPGAAAAGEQLFVPTDAGLVRVERDGDRLAPARSFPDTEPFVDAGARILVGAAGLHVIDRERILRLAFLP